MVRVFVPVTKITKTLAPRDLILFSQYPLLAFLPHPSTLLINRGKFSLSPYLFLLLLSSFHFDSIIFAFFIAEIVCCCDFWAFSFHCGVLDFDFRSCRVFVRLFSLVYLGFLSFQGLTNNRSSLSLFLLFFVLLLFVEL